MHKKEWFERWFGEEYKALYPHRDEAQAAVQVNAVLRAIGRVSEFEAEDKAEDGVVSAKRMLDVGCGAGRHLRAFRGSGFDAFGVDLSSVLIRDARATGLAVARADMRGLPFRDQTFHLVTCFFTSFGYFATVEEDLAALAGFRRLVRPSGFLFLDLPNAAHVAAHLVPAQTDRIGDRDVEVRRRLEGDTVVKSIRILSSMDSPAVAPSVAEDCAFEERVRLYSVERLRVLLEDFDFETVDTFGDENGAPFDPRASPRMSLLLRCP